jgi:hypothetical protein
MRIRHALTVAVLAGALTLGWSGAADAHPAKAQPSAASAKSSKSTASTAKQLQEELDKLLKDLKDHPETNLPVNVTGHYWS